MTTPQIAIHVHPIADNASEIELEGELTLFAEEALLNAYEGLAQQGVNAIILNFSKLNFMNSGGVGVLISLLTRTRIKDQKLGAYGLNPHHRHVFELTQIDRVIAVRDTQAEALTALA